MPVKSRLFNFIACLKFFIKSRKETFIYPMFTQRILIFLNVLWRVGLIFGYKIILNSSRKKIYLGRFKKSILVHLKSYWHNFEEYNPAAFNILSKAARLRYISYHGLRNNKLRDAQVSFLLSTCYGLLTSDEIFGFNLKLGGVTLCKFL